VQAETEKLVKETEKLVKETAEQMKETDKRLEKSIKETEELKKTVERVTGNVGGLNRSTEDLKKTAEWVTGNVGGLNRSMENLQKTVERVTANVGGLNRSLGELIETLIAARLWEKFPDYNLKRAYQRVPIFDEKNRIMTDIDILLSDTDMAMAVEVKRELDRIKDVDEHLKRMELIQKHPPAEVVGKKILGAMAGGVVDADVRRYAYESGFFVLELTGDTVELIPPPDGFVPMARHITGASR
jgi:chromosome segregation ATPase